MKGPPRDVILQALREQLPDGGASERHARFFARRTPRDIQPFSRQWDAWLLSTMGELGRAASKAELAGLLEHHTRNTRQIPAGEVPARRPGLLARVTGRRGPRSAL